MLLVAEILAAKHVTPSFRDQEDSHAMCLIVEGPLQARLPRGQDKRTIKTYLLLPSEPAVLQVNPGHDTISNRSCMVAVASGWAECPRVSQLRGTQPTAYGAKMITDRKA